jgi:integrase/recombinase XerD
VGTLNKKRVSCATHPICKEFGLHKFRHTYATTLLRDGVDILSMQKLLGHKDLDSTRRYLRALEPEDLLKKINLTSLATKFI